MKERTDGPALDDIASEVVTRKFVDRKYQVPGSERANSV